MCDVERWLFGVTAGGEETYSSAVNSSSNKRVASDSVAAGVSWDVANAGAVSASAGGAPATVTAIIPVQPLDQEQISCKPNDLPGWSQVAQCIDSWLLFNDEEDLLDILTLIIIIIITEWICISVFCQFYRFLARFSGRRRSTPISPACLHLPHPHVQQIYNLSDQQRHPSDVTPVSKAQDPLLRVSSSSSNNNNKSQSSPTTSSPSASSSKRTKHCRSSWWSRTASAARRMRPCTNYRLATLILVAIALLGSADACSSRSTPKPRAPSPTARPNVTFRTFECPAAYAEWYCLNGATCFTVKIGASLNYNCECADGYVGQRCEFKDLHGSYLSSRQKVMLEKASTAGGASIATVLVVVVFMALFIHRQRRRKELRTSVMDSENRPFGRIETYVSCSPNYVARTSFTPIANNPSNSMEMTPGAHGPPTGSPTTAPSPLMLVPPNTTAPVMLVSAQALQRAAEP